MSDEAKDPDKEGQPVIGNNLRIPDRASALRFMVGAAEGTGYIFFKTLEEARANPNAALIMEADSGGANPTDLPGFQGSRPRRSFAPTGMRPGNDHLGRRQTLERQSSLRRADSL